MQNDMRDLLRGDQGTEEKLSKNHRGNFKKRLDKELSTKKVDRFYWLKIAASILLIVGLGTGYFVNGIKDVSSPEVASKVSSLGEISPAFQNIENYYLTSINTEIASLDFSNDHRALLDGYLAKNDELSKEYQALSLELEKGVNEATITALIGNLQLRLKLLTQLRNHLNELKNQKNKSHEAVQI